MNVMGGVMTGFLTVFSYSLFPISYSFFIPSPFSFLPVFPCTAHGKQTIFAS